MRHQPDRALVARRPTLSFVRMQQRSAVAPLGDFDEFRDADVLPGAHPHNVFLVKASYWLG